jgi:hypothetical protein
MLPGIAATTALDPLGLMRTLRDVLCAETALAASLDRRRRELAVLDHLQKALPPALVPHISVADATRPELTLSVPTGAAATLVRHRAPELLETLARRGWKFTGIRVRVQARSGRGDTSKVYAKQMDPEATAALRRGAEKIADPNLAGALRRLAQCGATGSKDEQEPFQSVEGKDPQQKK